MKPIVAISIALFAAGSASAQVDLAHDPAKPLVAPTKSNAQLLKESQPATNIVTDTSLPEKYHAAPSATGTYNNGYMSNNPQPMNVQNQQYNIGGVKATNSVYYDNSGKVQGSGTTLDFGKKK